MKRLRQRADSPHVAFLVETSMAYGREMLHGVAQYLHENEPWTIYFEQRSLQDPAPPWLGDWYGDGIITRLSPQLSELVLKTGIPAVDLDDQMPGSILPNVQSDHEAIGALAAAHLLEQGFERFAFLGHPQFDWSVRRRDGFVSALKAAGRPCEEHYPSRPVPWSHQQPAWESETDGLSHWIAGLPKPLGLMACNDYLGVQALDACRRVGVSVPQDVAIIGVDNDTLACELAYPPLSSIIPDCRRIGYQAASMLDRLMKGERPSGDRHLVPPLGVAARQSTDVMMVADPLVARALRFVRERACDGIRVEDVLAHVSASRSVLQRRFRAALGRTIHDAIAEARLRRVKQLLAETDISLELVAQQSGYSHAEYMSVTFREATGTTPGTFRREHRRASPSL